MSATSFLLIILKIIDVYLIVYYPFCMQVETYCFAYYSFSFNNICWNNKTANHFSPCFLLCKKEFIGILPLFTLADCLYYFTLLCVAFNCTLYSPKHQMWLDSSFLFVWTYSLGKFPSFQTSSHTDVHAYIQMYKTVLVKMPE